MSGHKRVKDISYDDDGYDEYEEEGYEEQQAGAAPDPVEREQLRTGTQAIKELMGPDTTVTDKEIEEALWYYYFDVDKSVTYLLKQYAPVQQQAKKPKAPSRFEQAAQAAKSKAPSAANGEEFPYVNTPCSHMSSGEALHLDRTLETILPVHNHISFRQHWYTADALWNEAYTPAALDHPFTTCSTPMTAADFFRDTPWFNVPIGRRGEILAESLYPRGGLLGGAPEAAKPSKLAALAAARKKAQEEKKKASTSAEPAAPLSLMAKLSIQPTSLESTSTVSSAHLKGSDDLKRKLSTSSPSRDQSRKLKVDEPFKHQALESKSVAPGASHITPARCRRAAPSAFAQGLLGMNTPRIQPVVTEDIMITVPYATYAAPTDFDPFAGPSPDDVVLNAQAKGAKAGKSTSKKVDVNGATQGVAALKVEEAPKTKSRNLDVMAEYKKSGAKNGANFVVIGHVDHGKSTLMGRLLYDLKVVNQRSVDKLRKEAENIGKSSFALAWVMDSTSEERARGVTVDIATNYFETEKTRFTILDAPGHRDFIPNMIAGASQADFAVLVIDASTNAFEAGLRGQTKEHALLVRSMGIARLIIAVNKMDTAGWAQARFEEITQQTSAFLAAAGFQTKNVAFVPCAGLTGENVATKPEASVMPWYKGRTLVEELDASEPTARAIVDPLRLTISDVFRGGVTNPLSISGRLEAGSVQVGDALLAQPAGESGTVKGIEVDGVPVDWAVAGQIATLHLADIDSVHLRLGDIVCDPARRPLKNIKTFTAKVLAFEHLTPMWVDVHRGRLHTPARVTQLVAVLDKASGAVERKKVRVVQPGSIARIRVELERAMPLEAPNRVVLRAEGSTVAAGLLEEVG